MKWHLGTGLAAVLWLGVGAATASGIPRPPPGEQYLMDGAGLLQQSELQRIAVLQRDALEQFNSPVVVVTIPRIADYGAARIEDLAREWFDAWNIGTLGLQGGANQGILLLVASQDRKARIELGADWGHAWDRRAERIMNGTIVPRFKQGDFSGGIGSGVDALLAMAKLGPKSQPPGDFLEGRVRPLCKYSLLDPMPFLAMIALGVMLILLGVFGSRHNGALIITGIALILFAALSYFVIFVLFALFRSRGRGGGSSGRGFSGGFSGGGGATGSW